MGCKITCCLSASQANLPADHRYGRSLGAKSTSSRVPNIDDALRRTILGPTRLTQINGILMGVKIFYFLCVARLWQIPELVCY